MLEKPLEQLDSSLQTKHLDTAAGIAAGAVASLQAGSVSHEQATAPLLDLRYH